jgi:hypothetical protein
MDEEYLACLLSCVMAGSTAPEQMPRKKIRRILAKKPALRARLDQAKTASLGGQVTFVPEAKRVTRVLTKLAQGHALYELHESCAREPEYFSCVPLLTMDDTQREAFENPEASSIWPEVGSRAMQRLLIAGKESYEGGWLTVQAGLYRYVALLSNGMDIRIVINEYLACHAVWDF